MVSKKRISDTPKQRKRWVSSLIMMFPITHVFFQCMSSNPRNNTKHPHNLPLWGSQGPLPVPLATPRSTAGATPTRYERLGWLYDADMVVFLAVLGRLGKDYNSILLYCNGIQHVIYCMNWRKIASSISGDS